MNYKLLLPLLILFTGIFFSFQSDKSSKKILGSWKVTTIKKVSGVEKTGRKTLTFSKDNTFVSLKDTGSTMTGIWEYNKKTKILRMAVGTDEEWDEFEVIKLTGKEMVLTNENGTYFTEKVN